MKIGFVGLGKMGMQMTTRLLNHKHEVVAMDLSPIALQQASALGATTVQNRDQLLSGLVDAPIKIIWLMIPSQLVQSEIEAWIKLLPAGSLIIDGGNSDFRDTIKRAQLVETSGQNLIDVGTSGGILGQQNGFSMMVGGKASAVATIKPILDVLAQANGWAHFGPAGAGHFIKMTHNAIEYGLMEAYAEGFHLLNGGPYKDLDLGAIARVWQNGSIIASSLNALASTILSDNPQLDGIDGYVADTGEARWTLDVSSQAKIAMPVVAAALEVRTQSQNGQVHFGTKLLAALRNAFGGHAINKS